MHWITNVLKRNKYYEDIKDSPPSDFVLRTLKYGKFDTALDLGCGSGADTKEIARQGALVKAIDINSDVKKYFDENDKNIKLIVRPFQKFEFGKYDLIYAKSSIVFLKKEDFYKIIEKIKNALNHGGIFAVRFWGKHDSNNKGTKNNSVYLNINEIKEMFSEDFEILEINEIEKDSMNAYGKMKHWHFLDTIIRRK